MIRLESYPRRQERILAKCVSDSWVLLNLDSGDYYALNEVGGRVWELCDGARSIAEIVAIISQDYEAPRETIEADVLELLQDLANEKLVVEGSSTSRGAEATT
jgi:coenzyme PQQ biosynthesis protein PqqD